MVEKVILKNQVVIEVISKLSYPGYVRFTLISLKPLGGPKKPPGLGQWAESNSGKQNFPFATRKNAGVVLSQSWAFQLAMGIPPIAGWCL